MARRSQRTMFPTRAQDLGIKPKVLIARTRKALRFHRTGMTSLALPYADIDNSIEGALQELLAAFEAFEAHVVATAEWLDQEANT